ncbi:CBO0543 family protein [Cytobacillus sp.]|uniref:CBO0543 family protein n=1 Tax=Cytobacillus sp. TaxID=2675269 RepID=UPI0028BE7EAE|nr:CBO0543 family protein [Cytobacillus sp.]
MKMEYFFLTGMWIFGLIGFILFIPRKDRRKGFLALMMFQAIIWLCDMPSFQYGLLSAPFREFPKATDLALTINYFFYPALFSIYYINKKEKGTIWTSFTYFFLWVTLITLFDIMIERYTDLLKYGLLTWYGMWIYIALLFYVSQICCNWFYKEKALLQTERQES